MDEPRRGVGEQIARAARAFEKRRTAYGRVWVAVFLSEDTMTIALHGSLTAAEKALALTPAGAARVRERHGRLFAAGTAALRRRIKAVAGLDVRDAAAEVDLTASRVVHVLTTDTSAEEFVRALAAPAGARV